MFGCNYCGKWFCKTIYGACKCCFERMHEDYLKVEQFDITRKIIQDVYSLIETKKITKEYGMKVINDLNKKLKELSGL